MNLSQENNNLHIDVFENKAALNRSSKIKQIFVSPFHVFSYFLYTRLPFISDKPIRGKAKLFFNKSIEGDFPDSVFSFLYLYGFIEEDLTRVILKNVKPGMTFIDIGAHVGYFSALASVLVGRQGQIHSFEVTPRTYKILSKNLKRFQNVTTNLVAVWSKNTKLTFYDYGPFYAQCNSFTKGKLTDETLKKITPIKWKSRTTTLDSYCKSKRIIPGFVKIDAESAEYDILKGMSNILKKNRPIISLEIGDVELKGIKGSKDCIDLLGSYGYIPYNIVNGKFKKHKVRKDYYNIFDNLVFFYNGYHE